MKNALITSLLAITALAAGYWLADVQKQAAHHTSESENGTPPPAIQGALIRPERKIGFPRLLETGGGELGIDTFSGHWSILFFGYTNCPDVCPVTLQVLARAGKQSTSPFPRVYFVSVDPQRDDIEQLTAYVRYFDQDFVGITGEEKLIEALTLQLSAVYLAMSPEDPDKPDEYTVDHSASLYVLNPEGRLAAILTPPFTEQQLLKDIQTLTGKK